MSSFVSSEISDANDAEPFQPETFLSTDIWRSIPSSTHPPADDFVQSELHAPDASPLQEALLHRTCAQLILHSENPVHPYDIRGATLHSIIFLLCSRHSQAHEEFASTFFCTYRSFTTPETLFAKLSSLLEAAPPLKESVFRLLRHWFLNSFTDWSPGMKTELEALISRYKSSGTPLLSSSDALSLGKASSRSDINVAVRFLEKSYSKKCGEGTYRSVFASDASVDLKSLPPVLFHPRLESAKAWDAVSFIDLDNLEIARQFTITSSHFYAETQPVEFLDLAWSKDQLKHLAPNLIGMIQNFNRICAITSSLILDTPTLKERTRMMTKLIDIAGHFVELRNYDGAMAVISSLGSTALFRLRWTREALSKESTLKMNQIKDLFNPASSFSNYRQVIIQSHPPCIPFIGVYLTDPVSYTHLTLPTIA